MLAKPAALALLAAAIFSASAHAEAPNITLTEIGAGRWRIEYQLTEPADALHFVRSAPSPRAEAWRPADKAFVFSSDDRTLRRADGRPFTSAQFLVDARSSDVISNYEPFTRFSDGGVLVYTGYYFACANAPCTAPSRWKVTVEPSRRRGATRGAAPSHGPLTFMDFGDGSQVYVGGERLVETARYNAVIDPALPADVKRVMDASLPAIMSYYERRLGQLPRRPAVFVSMRAERGAEGYESRGSALPDQMSVHFYGARWTQGRTGVEPGFLPWYFAHEAAHLQQRIEDRPKADDFMAEGWIHEGGAEALAGLAVAATKPELRRYVDNRVSAAADECAQGLRHLDAPLNDSGDRGAVDNYYVCGLAMQMAINLDVREASHGARDLFDVWRGFLEETGRGASWNEATFLQAARSQGARDDTLRIVSTLARKRADWAQGALKERLLAAPSPHAAR